MDQRTMKSRWLFWVGLFAPLVCASVAFGQTSYPMLKALKPLAARIGETSEHEVDAQFSMEGAYQVIVDAAGVTGEVVDEPAPPLQVAVANVAKPESVKTPTEPDKKPEPEKKAETDKKSEAEKKSEADKNAEPAKKAETDKKAEAAKAAETAPVKKPEVLKLKVRFTVAKSALPGAYDFRVITPHGPSTLGQVVIVRDPVVVEKGPNDTLEQALAVELPATLCGAVEKEEDVDFYKFHVEAGTGLTFHVYSSRCMDRINNVGSLRPDPIIKVRNASGSVLAVSDNYYSADPLLFYRFAAAGDYYLEMRDVRYQGNAVWQYSIEVNDRPFVTNVFPLGITPEKPTRLTMIGFNLPPDPHVTVTLPGDAPDGPRWIELPLGERPANPVSVFVSRLPELARTPDDQSSGNAPAVPIPSGVNGCIAEPGQIDHFSFEAKKGERFSFEVVARRQQSALDPLLAVLNEKGARVIESDDVTFNRYLTADSLIENWSAPADGRYTLELRDVHLRGGPQYIYYLEATRSEPYFLLELDSDKTPLMPGMGSAIFARVLRRNGFTGEVALSVDGLPPGVTAACGRILDGANDGCIVLNAAPGASMSAANVRVTGTADFTADGKDWKLSATAAPFQEIHAGGGGRVFFPAHMQTVAVGQPLDVVSIKLEPTAIELKPGSSQTIKVTIQRAEGFDKNVTLDVMSRHLGTIYGSSLPAGVTIDEKASKTLLSGAQTEGSIVLKAAADAKPVEKQVVPVIASVALTFALKMNYAGEPVFVTVAKP
jgi:hypothetical protein